MTRLAVVGLGEHSCTRILPALARIVDAEVVVGVDPDAGARARAAPLAATMRTVATIDEALDHEVVEAVVVAAPPTVAPGIAGIALDRGIPVYLEKPGAVGRAELAGVVPGGARLTAGFCYRFDPSVQELTAQVSSGAIGRVCAARFVFASSGDVSGWKADPRAGGGALRDLAIHEIDLARVLTGDELHEVSAHLASRRTTDDTAAVIATTRGGVVVELLAVQSSSDFATIELVGDAGVLSVDRWSAPWARRRARRATGPVRTTLSSTLTAVSGRGLAAARAARRPGASQQRALERFLGTVRAERDDVPGLGDLMAALAVIEAAELAASGGRSVVVG